MPANDGDIFSSEVITEEFVLDTVDRVVNEQKVFRNAFRQIDSTDADSGEVQVPQVGDQSTAAGTVAEGNSIPAATSDEEDLSKVTITHDKYATAVTITREAVEDSALDVVEIHAEDNAEDMASAFNDAAFSELNANLNSNSPVAPGTQDGNITYDLLVDARTALRTDDYSPDVMFVSADSEGDLLKLSEFVRATDLGDEVVSEARIGRVLGMDVYVDTSGSLGAGEAIMVDSEKYGYESVRREMDSRQYEQEESEQMVVQIAARMGWKASQPEAGIKITG